MLASMVASKVASVHGPVSSIEEGTVPWGRRHWPPVGEYTAYPVVSLGSVGPVGQVQSPVAVMGEHGDHGVHSPISHGEEGTVPWEAVVVREPQGVYSDGVGALTYYGTVHLGKYGEHICRCYCTYLII